MIIPPLYNPIVAMQSKITGRKGRFGPVTADQPSEGSAIIKYPAIAIPASTSATEVTTFAGLINLRYPISFFKLLRDNN
jgi:hypothetical protein